MFLGVEEVWPILYRNWEPDYDLVKLSLFVARLAVLDVN